MTKSRLISAVTAFLLAIPCIFAVTDAEMEQARVIATQCYLRYANNGSGYLDDIHPKTMKELESKLKAKEKENIKAFNAIRIPADYASWDKKKLVEYWAATAFNSGGLLAEGKAARSRVRARINAMNVSAPSKPEEANPEHKAVPDSASGSPQPVSVPDPKEDSEAASADAAAADSIADARAEEPELTSVKKEDASTWIYVAILIVLVIVVVVLVVYAARTMKNNATRENGPLEPTVSFGSSDSEMEALREKFGKALAAKNEDLAKAAASATAQRERADMLQRRLDDAEAEASALRKENADLRERLAEARKPQPASAAPRPQAAPAAEPRRRSIYLGRVNSRGIFIRADRSFDPAHDIYCLETADGLTGSFFVVADPTLAEMALLTPMETLGGGCEIDNAADADTSSSVITEMRGTALFEDGCWRVGRKARVSFR